MKKILLILLSIAPTIVYAQSDTTYWNKGGKFGINFSQATLSNWAAGGSSSFAGTIYFSQIFDYQRENVLWQNTIDMGIGWIKETKSEQRKSDDRLVLTSSYGRKISSTDEKWYYNATLDFRTQFAKGYSEEDVSQSSPISKFMAPGYLLASFGIDWRPNEYFSLTLSPITGKFTFVNDDLLSAAGAFGVDPGDTFRAELGISLRGTFNKEIFTNVVYTSNLILFSSYLENPEKIDVNWENIFTMKINNVLSANIYNQIIYDYDIKFEELDDNGVVIDSTDKWQFKNIIGLGLALSFGGSRE